MGRQRRLCVAGLVVAFLIGCGGPPLPPVGPVAVPEGVPPPPAPLPSVGEVRIENAATPEPPPPPPNAETSGTEPAPIPAPGPGVQAQDEETARYLAQYAQETRVREQQARGEAAEYYRMAVERMDAGDLERARELAQRALDVQPDHAEARQVLNTVNNLLVGGPSARGNDPGQRDLDVYRVRIQQAELEVLAHIRTGERYMVSRQFEEAVDEFQQAEFKTNSIPFAYEPLQKMLPYVRQALANAQEEAERERQVQEEAQRQERMNEETLAEEAHHREVLQFIAQRLDAAYLSFEQRRFDECIRILDQILLADPHYVVAQELKEAAQQARRAHRANEWLHQRVQSYRDLKDAEGVAIVPYADTVIFPSRKEWKEISERAMRMTERPIEEGEAAEPDLLAARLDEIVLEEFAAADKTLPEILSDLTARAGVSVVVDPDVLQTIGGHRKQSFRVATTSVRGILRLVLGSYGLDHKCEGTFVRISTPERIAGPPVTRVYEVADLLVGGAPDEALPSMMIPGPRRAEAQTDIAWSREFHEGTDTTGDRARFAARLEAIVATIKTSVAPGTWGRSGYAIRTTPTFTLVVSHMPQIQDELREFLAKLRVNTATMISVTARFIAAFDDFLQDVGVNWLRTPAEEPWSLSAAQPDTVNSDGSDIAEPSAIVGPGFVVQENARQEYYDLRWQNFNTFRGGAGYEDFDIGRRIIPSGGLGVQVQLLVREVAAQVVLNALEKTEKATILQAPRITLYNTQQANIMVVRQTAYIQDYSAALAAAAGALDPEIGILMTGVVLGVRGIVSNDRKYVTLELQPTLAELQELRAVTIMTVQTTEGPFPVTIQLPHIVLQQARATVLVPDRGSILLSGLRDVWYRDVRTEIPILGRIPILQFLFSRQGKSAESRELMILVTPEILDLQERESQTY